MFTDRVSLRICGSDLGAIDLAMLHSIAADVRERPRGVRPGEAVLDRGGCGGVTTNNRA